MNKKKNLWFSSPIIVVLTSCLVLIVLGAIFIPMFCSFDYASQNVAFSNKAFFSMDPITNQMHIFGTDHLGRDIFARLWSGARISLTVAVAAVLIDCVVGVIYGSISGYKGGRIDNVMMRILEIVGGIPYMLVILLLMAVLPQGVGTLIIAYSLVGWTSMARIVRGQVMTLKKQEFVVAAKMMGAGTGRIVFRHLVPNMIGIIIVNITLDIPSVIFTEAFLSMLGMGVPAPYPSLGVMANEGIVVFQMYPEKLAVPAMLICVIMLAFNLLGDRLQDMLDPRVRRRLGYGKHTSNKKLKRVL